MRDAALEHAIKKMGSAAALADSLGIRPQAVHQWKRCPAKWVLRIEAVTGIDRVILRPDLYTELKRDE